MTALKVILTRVGVMPRTILIFALFCRRGIKSPGLHSKQFHSQYQAQVLCVQKAQLLCTREKKMLYQRPPQRGGRAHRSIRHGKVHKGHPHPSRCGALHPQLQYHQSRIQTPGKANVKLWSPVTAP